MRKMIGTLAALTFATFSVAGLPESGAGDDREHSGVAHDGRGRNEVDCDLGDTIAEGLGKLRPGQTLSIRGVCAENVEVSDAYNEITLDGGGTGVINAITPSVDTLRIYADQVTVRGLTISGGRDGVNLRGAAGATIVDNVIQGNASIGLNIHRVSWATVRNNVIRNNGTFGIIVYENSVARIGFTENSAAEPSPNTIEANGSSGIWVARSSQADIGGNIVRNNRRHGIHVDRSSQAEIRANDISQNAGNAVSLTFGAGVNLAAGLSSGPWQTRANVSSAPNVGFALACTVGGYTAGSLGALLGSAGPKNITSGCVDTVQ